MNRFLFYITLSCMLFLSACAKTQDITQEDSSFHSNNSNSLTHNSETTNISSSSENSSATAFEATRDDEFDEYFDDDYFDDEYEEKVRKDPLRPWNKTWFAFNDFILLKIAKPVYTGYTKVVPQTFRNGITNLRHNLKAPMRMGNALLQGEFAQFFIELGKLMINVMTSAGLADVASQNKPLYPHTPENLRFGYTLAKWNVPQGPYLILPFFGPSTPREAFGTVTDMAANPVSYTLPWEASLAISSVTTVNDFGNMVKTYELLKANALDPYIALRNAYLDRLDYIEPK